MVANNPNTGKRKWEDRKFKASIGYIEFEGILGSMTLPHKENTKETPEKVVLCLKPKENRVLKNEISIISAAQDRNSIQPVFQPGI